ncbi:MFS transporter [Rugosimonospora acidiphila]|uniref:MFS transporter n=1 Tax=Rugosimonospora acidiphila TaxID=556531 RepID=A0ABP9S6U3_9ACTN
MTGFTTPGELGTGPGSTGAAGATRRNARLARGAWRLPAPAILLAAWGGNHFSPLLLMYRQLDGYSSVQVNLFFACYVLGLIPGFLLAGPLSDRHGRKRLVVAALALGILGSVILGTGSTHVVSMCLGRLVSGVSVAVAMVVGTSWIKELSQHDAGPASRARRASLTLTAGFGLGAGVSGALAQWGPAPTLTPYLLHIALSLAALPALLRAVETRTGTGDSRPLLADLRVPRAGRQRFLTRVVPMAPWVFSAPALAFVVAPALVSTRVGADHVAFAALLAVVALCCGAGVQPFAPLLARRTGGRPALVGLILIAAATVLLAVDATVLSPAVTVLAAVLFGLGYGICIVSGLVEVQAIAEPRSLATLTGIYYSLTYLGFALPVLLSELSHLASYRWLLSGVAALCLASAGLSARRDPTGADGDGSASANGRQAVATRR